MSKAYPKQARKKTCALRSVSLTNTSPKRPDTWVCQYKARASTHNNNTPRRTWPGSRDISTMLCAVNTVRR